MFERGESELAADLLTSEEEDTFGSRMKMGGTTIPEYWTGHRSQCHPMFGAVSQYLFEYILGIRQEADSVCYEKVIIQPECLDVISRAEGHITTASGLIQVKYDEEKIWVQIPEKTTGVLLLDGKEYALSSGEETVLERR